MLQNDLAEWTHESLYLCSKVPDWLIHGGPEVCNVDRKSAIDHLDLDLKSHHFLWSNIILLIFLSAICPEVLSPTWSLRLDFHFLHLHLIVSIKKLAL